MGMWCAAGVAEEEVEGREERGKGKGRRNGMVGIDEEITGGGGEDKGEEVRVHISSIRKRRRKAKRKSADRIRGSENELPPGCVRWKAKA